MSTSPIPSSPTAKPTPEKSHWDTGDVIAIILSALSLAVAVLGWVEASKSRQIAEDAQTISQKTYDRAAGKIAAKLDFSSFKPTLDEIPARYKFQSPLGKTEVRLSSPEALQALDIRLIVQNGDEEIIEALRTETKVTFVGIHAAGKGPPGKDIAAFPSWRLTQAKREDFQLARKLLKGQKAFVPVTPALIWQIMKHGGDEFPDNDHYGGFEIRCFGRIVGASVFDQAERDPKLPLSFVWRPKDFSEDKCTQFLEKYNPSVELSNGQ